MEGFVLEETLKIIHFQPPSTRLGCSKNKTALTLSNLLYFALTSSVTLRNVTCFYVFLSFTILVCFFIYYLLYSKLLHLESVIKVAQ